MFVSCRRESGMPAGGAEMFVWCRRESGMPTQEVLTLAIESYRLWSVLLSYNLADTNFM